MYVSWRCGNQQLDKPGGRRLAFFFLIQRPDLVFQISGFKLGSYRGGPGTTPVQSLLDSRIQAGLLPRVIQAQRPSRVF